jgi:catechol 2,3-dioxygenase-like lactoylglutathione lyase family enzyme
VSIQLNHTIVRARDKTVAARFLADILGLPVGDPIGPFVPVHLANGVSLDYLTANEPQAQHYAFLVDDSEFDAVFARIQAVGMPFYGLPGHEQPDQLNHRWGGRGVYFDDPNGHSIELLTHPPTP